MGNVNSRFLTRPSAVFGMTRVRRGESAAPPKRFMRIAIASRLHRSGEASCANVAVCAATRIGFENRSMLRRLGLGISYFIAIVYAFSILWPCLYCFQHGCKGPGELDAFLPAFGLTPFGAIATAFSLSNAVQHIRKGQSSWVYWPLAIIFAVVLLCVIAFVGWVIYETAFHR